jgi:hypothetical protein
MVVLPEGSDGGASILDVGTSLELQPHNMVSTNSQTSIRFMQRPPFMSQKFVFTG